jgi:hypothetical protein
MSSSRRSLIDSVQRFLCLRHHYASYWRCVCERFYESLVHAALSIYKH